MHGVSKMVYSPKNHFWSNKYFINMMKHYDVHFILAFQLSDCYSSMHFTNRWPNLIKYLLKTSLL